MSDQIDPKLFRQVLGHLPTGVTVVTAAAEDGPVGVTIGSFVSISLDPPLVGFFLGVDSSAGEAISGAGQFCVNILAADQQALSNVMASRAEDRFSDVSYGSSPSGGPAFEGCVALIDCDLYQVSRVGDHDLFVGEVTHLSSSDSGDALVFYKGGYCKPVAAT